LQILKKALYLPAGEVNKAVTGEIKVVHIDEQTGTVGAEFLFGVLQEESGFSYATCPFDTNQPFPQPEDCLHRFFRHATQRGKPRIA